MRPARHAVLIAFLALALASLLNAEGLRKTAEIQPAGKRRDVAVALTKPLARLSSALYLDRPRHELKAAIGRGDDDRIDSSVVLSAAPLEPPVSHAVPAPATKQKRHRVRVRPKRRFDAAHPLRVWVAGDSLVEVPGQSLERAAGGPVRVVGLESRVATGLGRPDLYNWYRRFQQVIPELHPTAVVLSFGSNDAHDFMAGVPGGRSVGPIGSASWSAEYARRVDGVTREFAAAGAHVVWVGLPIVGNPARNVRFRLINKILRKTVERHPREASYVNTYAMFANSGHQWSAYLPDVHGRLVLMRAVDGVHYTSPGGDRVAAAVLDELSRAFDLRGLRRPAA